MDQYLQLKKGILQRAGTLSEAIHELDEFGIPGSDIVSRWREQLRHVESSLEDSLLRVAVIGSVKSGKSTLINSMLGEDLLKRGAGIITAFITRVVVRRDAGGWVEFKAWPQVLEELNGIVRLLPLLGEQHSPGNEPLDIRLGEDREKLRVLLERVRTDWQQEKGELDPGFVQLNGYLEGYAGVHERVEETVSRLLLDAHSLREHQLYVGHGGQAAYIRDMELHYPAPWLGEKVEIADCQGSDSPNPFHFELLQQYLLKSHFVIYVVSSRTGLREADFKLLDFIRSLRMFPQTFFVLNVDMDVHPHEEDLESIIGRVRRELGWITPNPRVYAFSALYHLADQLGDAAPQRERRRLELWREDEVLARHSQSGFSSFRDHLARRVAGERTRILVRSGLGRLGMVAGSVLHTASAQKAFLDENLVLLRNSAGELKSRQRALEGTLGTLANAISGLRDALVQEVNETVDRYFDPTKGPIVRETLEVVERSPVDSRSEKELTDYRQIMWVLHNFYLDFRQSLARYLVEKVNLRVIEFAKEQEAILHERIKDSSQAFWSLFTTALQDYRQEMARFHIELREVDGSRECEWNPAGGAGPPAFSAFMDREAVGRGLLLLKFGIGRTARLISGLRNRTGKAKDFLRRASQDSDTVQEAINLVKSEAGLELIHAFKKYHKEFKYGYLYHFIEEGTAHILDEFRGRAEMTRIDFANLLRHSEVQGDGRQSMIDSLTRIVRVTSGMLEDLDALECAVNPEW